MEALEQLYRSLKQRKRPEDVAELILQVLKGQLSSSEKSLLRQVANGALSKRLLGYTSMNQHFAQAVGAQKQVNKALELFQLSAVRYDGTKPEEIRELIQYCNGILHKTPGLNDFIDNRLNKEQREAEGIELSKRQYNKLWRMTVRLEEKLERYERSRRYLSLQQIAKNGLVREITRKDFMQDANTACFVAYMTARLNLRSEFTIDGQQQPFDNVCEMLLMRCMGQTVIRKATWFGSKKLSQEGQPTAGWLAIAHVYPSRRVLDHLPEHDLGYLMGRWTALLQEIARELGRLWETNDIDRKTMIVQRGNNSSAWNAAAGAWNKAREHWIDLLYATGQEGLLDDLCFGKVLRLMAGDVAFWHQSVGGCLDANTAVWNALPLPWEVFDAGETCTRDMVEKACEKAGLVAATSGWTGTRVRTAVPFRHSPELVHGVAVSSPFLAKVLRQNRYFSGKNARSNHPE